PRADGCRARHDALRRRRLRDRRARGARRRPRGGAHRSARRLPGSRRLPAHPAPRGPPRAATLTGSVRGLDSRAPSPHEGWMNRGAALGPIVALIAILGCGVLPHRSRPETAPRSRQFTFAWPFREGERVAPRGGTTPGPPVELDDTPGAAWEALREPGLDRLERDRRAIRAMAGTYRASFDFLEVAGFRPGFEPDRPYQSWGTEVVYVARDEPRFLRLQHLLVMFVQAKDGEVQGPFVVKHWRQDWRYEDRELLTYRGNNTWA